MRFDVPVLEPALVGRNVRAGQALKGAVLDLRGLGDRLAGVDDMATAVLVGRLLKVVRVMSVARVLVHPGEPWVDAPGVLGGEQDGTYRRASAEHVDDGVVLRLVLRRRHGRVPRSPRRRVRTWRLDSGRWRVRTEGRTVTVAAESPVMAIARMEALAKAGNLLSRNLVHALGGTVRHVGLARSSYLASK